MSSVDNTQFRRQSDNFSSGWRVTDDMGGKNSAEIPKCSAGKVEIKCFWSCKVVKFFHIIFADMHLHIIFADMHLHTSGCE